MSAADRQRRHRERQRKGVAVLPIEVDGGVYWALTLAGLVAEADLTNSSAVAKALGHAVKDWSTRQVGNALRSGALKGDIVSSS